MGVATAALDQPGDEGWAYGRGSADWQRLTGGFCAESLRESPCIQRPLRWIHGVHAALHYKCPPVVRIPRVIIITF